MVYAEVDAVIGSVADQHAGGKGYGLGLHKHSNQSEHSLSAAALCVHWQHRTQCCDNTGAVLTCGMRLQKAQKMPAVTTAAGSGGNTRRCWSKGNLWWQPWKVKCSMMLV